MPDSKTPEGFYQEHEEVVDNLAVAKLNMAYTALEAPNTTVHADQVKEVEKLIDKKDANLWRAREHYKAHEGEYHDQAVQDAKADGVEINVEKSKKQ